MPNKSSSTTPSSPSNVTPDVIAKVVKAERRDFDLIKRNKWWLILVSILLIIFIIWRCPILNFVYRVTGINLSRDCKMTFSLKDLFNDLSRGGGPNNLMVSNSDGSYSSVTVDTDGNVITNNLPTPAFTSGPTGIPGADGVDGFNGSNGVAGPAGPQGSSGAQGNSGSNGTNGTNGSNGATGAVGPAGAVGPMGPPGPAAPVPGVPCVGGEYLQWNGVAFVCVLTTNTLVNDGINSLTSTVNGVVDSDVIVNTNLLGLVGTNLTSTVNGVASLPIDLSSIIQAQNGTSVVGGFIELGLNPLLHDTIVPQAGFDMTFSGGNWYQDMIGLNDGLNHGIQSASNALGFPGFDGTIMYSSTNPNGIPGGGEGTYVYTTNGQTGQGANDGTGNVSQSNFSTGGFNFFNNTSAGSNSNINGSSGGVNISGFDAASGGNANLDLNTTPGAALLLTQTSGGNLSDIALNANTANLMLYEQNNATGALGNFTLDSSANQSIWYIQDNTGGVNQVTLQPSLGQTSIFTQGVGGFNTFILDDVNGLTFNGNSAPIFASNQFSVSQLGDVEFDRELRPGGNPGNANEMLISLGVGVPPVWTDPATFIGNYAITSINGQTGPAITITSNDFITTSTGANTVTLGITACAAGETYIYNGAAWVCTSAPLPYVFQNGLTESPIGTVELGGVNPLLHDTDIISGGFDFTFDGAGLGGNFGIGGAAGLKKLSVYGDLLVTGVIDPTAILFSDQTPSSYNPAATNGFKIGNTGATNRPIYVSNFANTSDTFQIRRADDTTVFFDADAVNQSIGVKGQAGTYSLTVHDNTTAGVLITGAGDLMQNFSRTGTGSVFTMRNNNATIMHLNANNGASLAFAATTGASTTATQMALDTNGNLVLGSTDSLPTNTYRQQIRTWNGTTNSVLPSLLLGRDVTGFGAGATGIGTSLDFQLKADDGNNGVSGRILSVLDDASSIGLNNPESSMRFNVLVDGVDTEAMRLISGNISGAGTTTSAGFGVTNPLARLHLGVGTVGVSGNDGFMMDGVVDAVATTPALSLADSFRMYYEDTTDLVMCSINGGAYTACFGSGFPLTTANNGLSVSGTTVQLGGPLIQDTLIDDNGLGNNLYIGSTTPIAGFYLETTGDQDYVGNNISLSAASGIALTLSSALSVNTDPGTAGQVLMSQGGGLPPIWSTGSLVVSADNGLSINPANNVQLGGPLIQDTTITNSGFDFVITGTGNGSGKLLTVEGDMDVQGVIDPDALLFSDGVTLTHDEVAQNGFRIGVTGATQRPIYVSPMTDAVRAFEVRDAALTNTIFDVDTTNKRIGINTTSPSEQLHLVGDGTAAFDGTNGIRLSQPDVTSVWETRNGYVGNIISPGVRFGNVTNTTLAFMTNNTIRMTIGNTTDTISMGGAVPVTNLNVADLDDSTSILKLSNIGTANTLSDGFDLISNSTTAQFVNNDSGGYEWHTNAVGSPGASTLRMDMDQYGHLDLNPDLPGGATAYTALTVLETINTANQTQPIRGVDISFNDGAFDSTNTNMGLRVDMSGLSGGTNYSGIFLGGNVGIGNSAPAQSLDVTGTIRQSNAVSCDLTTNASGDIQCVSDETKKDLRGNYQGGLAQLMQMNTIKFNYKGENYEHIGFSAQNVASVLPQAAPVQSDGTLGFDSTAVLALTVNSIQEQQTQITTLSIDMEGLKSDVNELAQASSPTPSPEERSGILAMITDAINEFFNSVSVAFNKTATFLSGAVFKGEVKFANNSAGYAVITNGAEKVVVKFTTPFSVEPIVNISSVGHFTSAAVDEVTTEGFSIKLSSPASADLRFTWTALIVDDSQTSTSVTTSSEEVHVQPSLDPVATEGVDRVTVTITPEPTTTTQSSTPTTSPEVVVTDEASPSEAVTAPSPEVE